MFSGHQTFSRIVSKMELGAETNMASFSNRALVSSFVDSSVFFFCALLLSIITLARSYTLYISMYSLFGFAFRFPPIDLSSSSFSIGNISSQDALYFFGVVFCRSW